MGKASILFQPADEPPAGPVYRRGVDLVPIQPGRIRVGEGEIVGLGVRHPLEDLHAVDMAKMISPGGEDYTLSFDRTISLRANSHVFMARHSDLPHELAVKVIRPPSGPTSPGESGNVANRLQGVAEMSLREVKIHSQLSQHVSSYLPLYRARRQLEGQTVAAPG